MRRRLSPLLLALLLTSAVAPPSLAAWSNNPFTGNNLVSNAANSQMEPSAVSDGAGGVLIAWTDTRAGVSDIYAQHLDAAGVPLWTANGIAVCNAGGQQTSPRVVSDNNGGMLVVWLDSRTSPSTDIYCQRVLANGTMQFTANGVAMNTAAGSASELRAISDGLGGIIACWLDSRAGGIDVYAQRITNAGTPFWTANGVAICTAASTSRRNLHMATDLGAGAVIAWDESRILANAYDIYASRVLANGAVAWAVNGSIVCSSPANQTYSQLCSDGTGGAIIAFNDDRNGNSDIYAQRTNSSGAPQWGASGVPVCANTLAQDQAQVVSDGFGGALIAWSDYRSSTSDVYCQRVYPDGGAAWTLDGVGVCTATGSQEVPVIASDGQGGALLAWQDWRFNNGLDVFAQRLSSTGSTQWTTNGTSVCQAFANQGIISLVSDGAGGAIAVWQDTRSGTTSDVYAQRIERYGFLGSPEPSITSVADVKNDQGGAVKVTWSASYLDADPTYGITEYRVFRSVPGPLLANGANGAGRGTTTDSDEAVRDGKLLVTPNGAQVTTWEFVGTQAAEAFPSYSRVVATTADSVGGSNPRTYFLVEARASTSISSDRWSSAPDSGYSVDNLAPAAPAPLTGQYAAGTTQLHWNRNTEADLAGYRLYRGASVSFVPSPANFVAQLPDTGTADAAGAPYVYKLTAVDVHGNESPVATLIPSGTLGVDDAARATLSFAAPSPNPARGSATLRWSTSKAGLVKLSLYDAAGRRVAVVHDGVMEAGTHAATLALRDGAGRDLAAGLYLARLEAEGRTITRRVAVVC